MNAQPQTTAWSPPSALAPRRTPEAYVRAEVAAFPLTHLAGFHRALVQLDPRLSDPGTIELWQACERTLSEHASGWSLDRTVAARDHSWFGEPGGRPVPLHSYLRRLAHTHLRKWTPATEIRSGSEASELDAANHYRWLTFALPEDLLLAALEVDPPPVRVDLEPPLLLRRLLDLGVAEIHHHIGAGMDFPLLWTSALCHLASPSLGETDLAGQGLPFDGGKLLIRWLLVAAIARTLLAELLIRRRAGGSEAPHTLKDLLKAIRLDSGWRVSQKRLLSEIVKALEQPKTATPPDFYPLQDLYRELHPQADFSRFESPRSLAELWQRGDPIAVRLGLQGANAGERWLIRQGLSYLETPDHGDPLFATVFWQVMRLRIQYYRVVVQRPMTAGLQWFVRFYGRIGKLRPPLDDLAAEASFQTAGRGHVISALEVRTSPQGTSWEIARTLRSYLASWQQVLKQVSTGSGGPQSAPEFGLVFHLVKQRDPAGTWSAGRPPSFWAGSHAQPERREVARPGRFADFLAGQATRARALGDLLRAVPLSLWLVRGIDVASDELSVPTWVLVPLMRAIRHQGALAAADPRARGVDPLHVTAHVGEDFRHLTEGLRRIHECVDHLLGSRGRLGHATALGVEPRSWAESMGSVLMPAEERLWDLVWEWRLYTGFRLATEFAAEAPPGRQGRVDAEIRELADRIFGGSHPPNVLAELHHTLHRFLTPPIADVVENPSLTFERAIRHLRPDKVQSYPQVRKLLDDYCHQQATFLKGQRLVDITLDASEIAALYALQNAVRRGVGFRGIVVEVNPSSNLLIGDLLDLRHHPILRLFPPEPEAGDGPPPVPIAVGSDDPLTFNTYLLREYALLFDAARAAGYPERTVQDWLERIRATGLDARFTLPWRPSPQRMAEDLIDALDEFLQEPFLARRRAARGRAA